MLHALSFSGYSLKYILVNLKKTWKYFSSGASKLQQEGLPPTDIFLRVA